MSLILTVICILIQDGLFERRGILFEEDIYMDWKSILDKWDKIMSGCLILLVLATQVPDYFPFLNKIDGKMTLTLFALALILWEIVKVLHQTDKLESSTIELNNLINQPDMNKVIKPFSEHKDINDKIGYSNRICLLSRTGQRWWSNNLEHNIKYDTHVRLLVLDPRAEKDSAFRMHLKSNIEIDKKVLNNASNNAFLDSERIKAELFLHEMAKKTNVELRLLNYLPAWSLLILENSSKKRNSGNKGSIIYCELAPYRLASDSRPVLKVTEYHNKCFNYFQNEFERLWDSAEVYPCVPSEIK